MFDVSARLVSLSNVSFSYGTKRVFENLDLELPANGVNVVMGPSGCGKSTLLGLIGRRMPVDAGTVSVFGTDVATLSKSQLYDIRRRMGVMFQSNALLTDLSVFENVAFPVRENTNLPESLIRKLVILKLEQVGLRGTQHLMPADLSGGMSRRVALARATALDPELILYDEPFTGLDPISMGVITKLVREVNDALEATSVVITHDVEQGLSIADFAILLGSGGVLATGTAQELLDCPLPEVRQFLRGLPDGPVPFHYPAQSYRDELLRRH